MKKLLFLVFLFLTCNPAFAQWGNGGNGFEGGPVTAERLRTYTVAQLPNAGLGNVAIVTDGADSTDCTSGGGSTQVDCMGNGTTWEATGGGGGGGGGSDGNWFDNGTLLYPIQISRDIYTNGDVGIGTSAPTAALHVAGAIKFTGALTGGTSAISLNSSAVQMTANGFSAASGQTTGSQFAATGHALTSGNGFSASSTSNNLTGKLFKGSYTGTGSGNVANFASTNASATGDVLVVSNAGTGKLASFTGTGDVFLGSATLDNASASEDLMVAGNLQVDGQLYGDGSALTAITPDLTLANTYTIGDNSSGDIVLTFDGDAGTDGTITWDVSEDAFNFSNVVKLFADSAPTVDTPGDIAFDSDLWASGRGGIVVYDGTAATGVCGTLLSDTPNDGEVQKWNGGGTCTWEPDNNSGGVTIADTLVAYATATDTVGGEADFYYDDTTNTLYVGSVQTAASASPSVDFDDLDDTDVLDGSIYLDCPTATDCDMTFAVNSGSDVLQTLIKIDTTDAGATTIQMGDVAGGNYINIDEAGAMTAVGTASIPAAAVTYSKSITLELPTTADTLVPVWTPDVAITFTRIYCVATAGTATVNLTDDTNDVDSITCVGAGAEDNSLANASFSADETIYLEVTGIGGTPTWVNLTGDYTLD